MFKKLIERVKAQRYKLRNYDFTSESVCAGHPDKICDQISDMLLDEYLRVDPNARVAIESLVAPNNVVLAGEVSSVDAISKVRIEELVRALLSSLGYNREPFAAESVKITNLISNQSREIAQAVHQEGAGDQGIMFGYACDETQHLMPAPIYYAHKLAFIVDDIIRSGGLEGFHMDGKTQMTVVYNHRGEPVSVDSIVLSKHHDASLSQQDVTSKLMHIIREVVPANWLCDEERIFINPSGSFAIGGPESDAGLTGRKIIVDTYGGAAPHGGGAFSGKDPSKVDRSAAYMGRYIAKNVVAAGLATKCLIQLSYAIGISKPVSIFIDTFGTAKVSEHQILKAIEECIDLTPKGIRHTLDLNRPIYFRTATYGHFGRVPDEELKDFTWEKLDLANTLLSALK